MTQAFELHGDERVLEVGCGSGYSAAVLSLLCRELVTIERHVALADQAKALLRELGRTNADVMVGDGTLGAPDRAPFDAISVTATAEGGAPPALLEQLAPRGTLVCPIRRPGGEHLVRIRGGQEEIIAAVRFVPLVSDQ
jgi:protein-L-isoaspartate(D-aspartate) O-methyltransferase